MSEEVKQEGEFKIKAPSKPKNLGSNQGEITKVNIKEPLVDIEPSVTKVVIPKEQEEANAIQTQETNDSDVVVEKQENSVDSKEVAKEVPVSYTHLTLPTKRIV